MAIINNAAVTQAIQTAINNNTLTTELLAQYAGVTVGVTNVGIYKQFGEFDKVNEKTEVVTTGLWSGDSGSLTNLFTSSVQVGTTSAQYYYNIYDYDTSVYADKTEVQFAVAYGHIDNSGSMLLRDNDNSLLASKATYAQYKSMLLDPTDTSFTVARSDGSTANINDIYIINVNPEKRTWNDKLTKNSSSSVIDKLLFICDDILWDENNRADIEIGKLRFWNSNEYHVIYPEFKHMSTTDFDSNLIREGYLHGISVAQKINH